MIQSYKQNLQLNSNYDTIIIGSGMGGMATGAILAKQGQKVLILERHYTAGGFTHVFKRKGYEWDVGIHYIGEMQRPNSLIKKLFDYVTNSQLKWADMGNVYDRIIVGDKAYDFVKGTQNFKQKLISYFPKEEQAIDSYIKLVFEAVKSSKNYYMSKVLPSYVNAIIGGYMRKPFYKWTDKTTYEVLKSLTDNEELIKVLTGQYGDYGMAPKESSFYMHASVVRHYLDGGSFPIGGSSQIAKTIDAVIEKAGGTILINADVKEVIIKSNNAKGVLMADDKSFYAKNIISNAGIFTTYTKLLPESIVVKHNLKAQLKKVKQSVAHVSLYIGLEASPEVLNLPKTNHWIYPKEGDHDTCVKRYLKDIDSEFPMVYISFPSSKDPDFKNRYPNKSTIDVITLMPYDIFASWEATRWKKRGDAYDALKEKMAQRLLEVLYKQVPQVKGKVAYYELSTPLTTQHFVNYSAGEIYGLDHSPSRFRQDFLKPKTPIKNFYLTGQDIVTAGVGGALFSGVLTSMALTGKNVLKNL